MTTTPTAPKCPIVPGVRIMSRKRLIDGNYNHFADAVSPEIAEWMRDAIEQHPTLLARCKALEEAMQKVDNAISASFVSVPYEGKAEFAKERLGDARDIIAAALAANQEQA